MGDLHKELAGLCRIARPVEFDSGGELVRGRHPAVTADTLAGQHPVRAWEYSQALRAFERWYTPLLGKLAQLHIADVGGAGSNFYKTLVNPDDRTERVIDVIDPSLPTPDGQTGIVHGLLPGAVAVKYDLAEWARFLANVGSYDTVFCLSVIEHVADPQPFLSDLCSLVRPGGLLFLTMDCGEHSGYWQQNTDTYHFHWMRKWIAEGALLEDLANALQLQGFDRMDPVDPTYRGPTVFDYTVASLAFVRRT